MTWFGTLVFVAALAIWIYLFVEYDKEANTPPPFRWDKFRGE